MRIIFVFLFFNIFCLIKTDDEQDEWKYPEDCLGYGCDYKAQWKYIEKTDEIKFVISTKFRNKWTGIGFSDSVQMKGTDAVLGLVEDNGRYFLMDTYLSSYQAPPLDAVQNIHNMSVWRENGITHLQFHRFRKTSDPEYDFQFTDDHCAYFHFPVKGGVFNAVNKRMRKHEEIPIVSKKKICIRSKDYLTKNKNIIEPNVQVNVPKFKIPNRFKSRPKQLSTTTISPIVNVTTISNIKLNNIDQSSTQKNSSINIDKTKISGITVTVPSITISSTVETSTIKNFLTTLPNELIDDLKNIENKNLDNNEENIDISNIKNEDKIKDFNKVLLKNDDKTKMTKGNSLPEVEEVLENEEDSNSVEQDGRILANNDDTIKSPIKTLNFQLKIINKKDLELNSSVIRQETEKELSDLTGFQQLRLSNLDKLNNKIWLASFELQVQPTPSANESDYLAYLQNALNETVATGQIGSLQLDASQFALLKQANKTNSQPEAKYAFEYTFYNQFTIKLTKDQLKLVCIGLGVTLLVLLVLMQACCMCCSSNKKDNNLNNQNNLSNSSTLQDKHQLNFHHHPSHQYKHNDHFKNCGSNYSYENFGLDTDGNYEMASSCKRKLNSLSKHDMYLNNSYHRRKDFQQPSYNYGPSGTSHLRYFEPQPVMTSLQPDFYFMPHQRRYSGEMFKMFVDYDTPQFITK